MNSLLRKVGPRATDMIRADHTRVMALFHRYKADSRPGTKQAIVRAVSAMLQVHARMEEDIFYPAMRQAGSTLIDELVPEHEEMRTLIAQLSGMDPQDPEYDATFMELMRDVIHHVADEETVVLTSAEATLGDRLNELGAQMAKRRLELMAPMAKPSSRGWMVAAGAVAAGLWFMRRRAA